MKVNELLEANELDLAHLADQVYDAFKRHPEAKWVDQTNKPKIDRAGNYQMDFRDWGQWENPSDAEDEEDYDWQELTPKSRKAAAEVCAAMEKTFKGIKVKYGTGEKNYLEVSVGLDRDERRKEMK